MLVRHPRVMERVRAEISSLRVGRGASVKRDDLRNPKYLQNVLKEGEKPPTFFYTCFIALAVLSLLTAASPTLIPVCSCQYSNFREDDRSAHEESQMENLQY